MSEDLWLPGPIMDDHNGCHQRIASLRADLAAANALMGEREKVWTESHAKRDRAISMLIAERDAAQARVGELEQAEKDIASDLAHLLAVAVSGLADAAIVADQSLGVEHVHSAVHKLADYARELKHERDAARAELDDERRKKLQSQKSNRHNFAAFEAARAEATALREALERISQMNVTDAMGNWADQTHAVFVARAALAAAAVPEPAPDAKPRLGEWQMCACGHFGRSHTTIGGNCSECSCDRFHYPKGRPAAITLDVPAADAREAAYRDLYRAAELEHRLHAVEPECDICVAVEKIEHLTAPATPPAEPPAVRRNPSASITDEQFMEQFRCASCGHLTDTPIHELGCKADPSAERADGGG